MHNKLTSSCTRYKDTKIHRYKNVDDDEATSKQHHHDDDNDELHGNALEDDNNYNDKSVKHRERERR